MASGFYGGTFDPPHLGHLIAAEAARTHLGLERVAFVPAGEPPHKRGRTISPVAHRVEMVRRAIADNPAFCLSLADVSRPGPHYTVDTVPLLRRELGEAGDLYLILGADMLEDLLKWYRPGLLLEHCRIAAVARPGYTIDLPALEARLPGLIERVAPVPMPMIGISSTELRARVAAGGSIRYQVPAAVEAYIAAHGLYRLDTPPPPAP